MESVFFALKRSDARLEPVLFTVVNGPQLTRAISRRRAIARRRRRSILFIDNVRYAFQPRAVLAHVGARGFPRRRAGESSKSSYGVWSGTTTKWCKSRATPWKPSKCAYGVRVRHCHQTSCVFAAIHHATFLCTFQRRRHRGLPSACAWRPLVHAILVKLVSLTRRYWSKSI